MALSDLIHVTISIERAAAVAAGFGVPMICGPNAPWVDDFREYDSSSILDDMVTDGYTTSDAEYVAAQAMVAGDDVPELILIGSQDARVAQTRLIVIPASPTNSVLYRVIINGTNCDYTTDGSATQAELQAGLLAAINAAVGAAVTATAATNDVLVTSDEAGIPFSITVATGPAAPITLGTAVANVGIEEDLSRIRAAGANWYGTCLTTRDDDFIQRAALWTETHSEPPTIYMAQSSDSVNKSTVLDANGTDLANILCAAGYDRTALWQHGDDTEALDAAILGRELPVDPGLDQWALKELELISADTYTTTEKNNLIGSTPGASKNANIYYALTAQNNITFRGTMASGEWIDVIRFVDFLKARISEAIANLMLGTERVNFDEMGLQLIAAQVTGVLQAAKEAKKVSSYSVTIPPISAYTSTARTTRTLDPPITFSAQLSGALLDISIDGSVVE